jgi:hypothetical protein
MRLMTAMTGIRLAITVFILILLSLVALGWSWTSAHQTPSQAMASHVVLGLAGLSGVIALVTIWRPNRSKPGPGGMPHSS